MVDLSDIKIYASCTLDPIGFGVWRYLLLKKHILLFWSYLNLWKSFSRASVKTKRTLGRTSLDRFHENSHMTTYCRRLKLLLSDCCHDFLFHILVWKDMVFSHVTLCSRECLVKPTHYFLRHFQYFSRHVIPLFALFEFLWYGL